MSFVLSLPNVLVGVGVEDEGWQPILATSLQQSLKT